MELHDWLDAVPGRATWLADELGVTKAAVSQWRDSGVPLVRVQRVAELTGGEVTEEEMLRHAMRCKTAA